MKAWDSSFFTRFTYKGLRNVQPARENETHSNDAEDENQTRLEKTSHWIRGVYICAGISTAVLLINVILVCVGTAMARKNQDNPGLSSFEVLYDGNCALSKRWDIALHLIINALSTTILAASNYTMQTLVAPSREEVDSCHNKGKWLDIGTPSTRNLFVVGWYRAALWFVLLVTATPFHLLYNSVVFGALGINRYSVIIAPSDLDPSDAFNYTTPGLESCFATTGMPWGDFASLLSNGTYKRVDAQECESLTFAEHSHGMRAVVALSDELTVRNGGDLSFLTAAPSEMIGTDPWRVQGRLFSNRTWAFTLPTVDGTVVYQLDNYTFSDCTNRNVINSQAACSDADRLVTWLRQTWPQILDNVTTYINTELETAITAHVGAISCLFEERHNYQTDDCLIFETDDRCKLVYNLPLSLAVIGAAVVKVVAMFLAARLDRSRTAPLLTVGDAVATFLARPDDTTKGRCWITKHDVRRGTWAATSRPCAGRLPRRGLWIQAASTKRWMMTFLSCGTTIGVGIYLLTLAAKYLSSLNDWWSEYGFGEYTTNSYNVVDAPGLTSSPALATVIVANTPQFAVTVSYYFYNNVLTNMLAASEYDSYGAKRNGLRVSWPQKNSSQRSTYWLSIPYHYNIPLLITYMTLHWTVSQSLFYVQTVTYDVNLQLYKSGGSSELVYSPVAILISIILGGLMGSVLLGLALCRRFRSKLPLAGSCSLAISAACHPGSDEDLATAALGGVKWGETMTFPEGLDAGEEIYHCSFSSKEVSTPSRTKLYT